MQEAICVQKAGKVFDTIVHKSFQRFHIYYISFTEAILIFSAWLTEKKLYSFDTIIFPIRLLFNFGGGGDTFWCLNAWLGLEAKTTFVPGVWGGWGRKEVLAFVLHLAGRARGCLAVRCPWQTGAPAFRL